MTDNAFILTSITRATTDDPVSPVHISSPISSEVVSQVEETASSLHLPEGDGLESSTILFLG
jgi:hypothetical protein